MKKSPRTEQQEAVTLEQLKALARRRGYDNPEWWAKKILAGRARKKSASPYPEPPRSVLRRNSVGYED